MRPAPRRLTLLLRVCTLSLLVSLVTASSADAPASADGTAAIESSAVEPGSRETPQGTQGSGTAAFTLYHHAPRRERGHPAVIAVPGLGFNARLFDLSKEISFAQTLAARGFSVYRLEPDWKHLAGDRATLSDLIRDILPAAVGQVRKAEPERSIILLGHGLGATLVAGYLGASPPSEVAGGVLIAPVLSLRFPDRALRHIARQPLPSAEPLVELAPYLSRPVPFRPGGDFFHLLLTNRTGDYARTLKRDLEPAMAPVPASMLDEVRSWVESGCCPLGARDLFRELPRIKRPVLLISGIADNIARREDVERATLHIGAADREYRMMSVTNFYRRDYGHLDLIATSDAVREVYPLVVHWLEGKRSRRVLPGLPASGDVVAPEPAP